MGFISLFLFFDLFFLNRKTCKPYIHRLCTVNDIEKYRFYIIFLLVSEPATPNPSPSFVLFFFFTMSDVSNENQQKFQPLFLPTLFHLTFILPNHHHSIEWRQLSEVVSICANVHERKREDGISDRRKKGSSRRGFGL